MSSHNLTNQDVNSATDSVRSLIEGLKHANYSQDIPRSSDTTRLNNLRVLDGLLTEASSVIRQYLNTAVPINRCPGEILSEMFALSATNQLSSFSSDDERVSFVLVEKLRPITLVCRSWRNLAISTPSLWCDVVFDRRWRKDLSLRCLTLAKSIPLRLHARSRREGRSYGDEAMRTLRDLPAQPPHLTHLAIDGGPRIDPSMRAVNRNGEDYFGGLVQRLQRLSLHGILCLPTDHFPNLTYFGVSGFGYYPLRTVLSVLSNMPRLEMLYFCLGIEEGSAAHCGRDATVKLPYLRQLTAHRNASDVVQLLSMIKSPSPCVVQFKYTTREELVSIAGVLYTPDFSQNLTRLRILPDPIFNNGDDGSDTSLYFLELLNDTGTRRLSLGIYEESGLWTADDRTRVTDTLVELFSSLAGAKLVSNIKELWVHNWTDLANERLLAVIPPIHTLGLVLARQPYVQTYIPGFIAEVTEAGSVCHCPNLTSLYVYTCGADDVDCARAIAAARKDAGRRLQRLAIECEKEPGVQCQALELGGLVHELSVTVQEKKRGWWKACTVSEGWSRYGPCPWPERREWSSLRP
ncbi:hypothetical protein LXA43DRAFT_1098801 [Ganoderma leucocontextum]|nr:hypothetical protein LXA43DRAFT_1098801 [Ganoderma leucocontextum]